MSVGTDFPDWSPHVAAAQQIAATGVPLLGNPVQLVNTSGSAGPGLSFSSGVFAVGSNIAFDLIVGAYVSPQNVATAALCGTVTVTWYADSGGTISLYRERWGFWLGNAAGFVAPLTGHGPMHGPFMKVEVFNPGSASNITVSSLVVYGTARPPIKSDWRQATPGSMSGGLSTWFTLPNADGADGLIMNLANFAFAANSTVWMPMALNAGPIWIRWQQSGTFTNVPVIASGIFLTNGALTVGTNAPGALWLPNNTSQSENEARIICPRGPLYAIANTGATPPTLSVTVSGVGP